MNQLLYKNLYLKAYSRAWFTMYGVLIREYRCAFGQFFSIRYPLRSFLHLIVVLIVNPFRIFFGRSHKSTFSFTGEDRIIEGILKPKITETGFYVDVGCNHPIFLSNTYLFYRRGWRGVCVDANKSLTQKFKYLRPRDKAVHALVSDVVEEKSFAVLTNNVLSTTELELLEEYKKEGQEVDMQQMTSSTLTQILDQHKAPREFELLTIDAEEHDLRVLRSLDLEKYIPRLIVLELEKLVLSAIDKDEVVTYLKRWNYSLIGYVLKNAYFAKI